MSEPIMTAEARNAIDAIADLAGRCGAREFQIGYLHDDVPLDEMAWYAQLKFQGTRLIVENQPSPAAAAQGLAERILTGAQCRCGKLVALSDDGAVAYHSATLIGGEKWTRDQAQAAGQCRWRLVGVRWEPSCPEPNNRTAHRGWRR